MISLVIDTSANICAVAAVDASGSIAAQASEDIGRGHAERLIGMIEAVLNEAAISFDAVGKVFCVAGPGSFTGVRVGLATARGLGLGLSVPVHGLNSLDGLIYVARQMRDGTSGPLLAVADARRDEAFCQFWRPGERNEPFIVKYGDRSAKLDVPENLALCGSGARRLAQAAGMSCDVVHDLQVAPVAALARMAVDADVRLPPPEPIYLRTADAKPQTGFAVTRR